MPQTCRQYSRHQGKALRRITRGATAPFRVKYPRNELERNKLATIQNLPFCSSLYASSCSRRDARASAERRVAVAQSWLKPAANVGFNGPEREREGGKGADMSERIGVARTQSIHQSWLKPAAKVGFKGPVREREEGGMGGDRYVRKKRPVAVAQSWLKPAANVGFKGPVGEREWHLNARRGCGSKGWGGKEAWQLPCPG